MPRFLPGGNVLGTKEGLAGLTGAPFEVEVPVALAELSVVLVELSEVPAEVSVVLTELVSDEESEGDADEELSVGEATAELWVEEVSAELSEGEMSVELDEGDAASATSDGDAAAPEAEESVASHARRESPRPGAARETSARVKAARISGESTMMRGSVRQAVKIISWAIYQTSISRHSPHVEKGSSKSNRSVRFKMIVGGCLNCSQVSE